MFTKTALCVISLTTSYISWWARVKRDPLWATMFFSNDGCLVLLFHHTINTCCWYRCGSSWTSNGQSALSSPQIGWTSANEGAVLSQRSASALGHVRSHLPWALVVRGGASTSITRAVFSRKGKVPRALRTLGGTTASASAPHFSLAYPAILKKGKIYAHFLLLTRFLRRQTTKSFWYICVTSCSFNELHKK